MSKSLPICHLDQLRSIEDEWVEIHADSHLKSPFLSFEFLVLWYECFSLPDDIRIYRAIDGGRTVGFLPLVLRRKKKIIRVLTSLTHDHCFHTDPLVRRDYETVFPALILKELFQDRDGWDVFWYSFSYSFSQFPGLFSDELLKSLGVARQRLIQPTYSVLLNKSFDDYFRKDLSSNTRKNFMRFKNRLARAGSYAIGHYQGRKAIAQWPEFVRIEDSGWKGNTGSSIRKISSNFQRYYQGLLNLLADKEVLNMYFLELNGKPIAGVFGYVEGNTFHWAKTGYDKNFKCFSPSNQLLIYILEHLFRNFPQIKRFHMFPWDYAYKHRFVNTNESCIDLILYNKTLRGISSRLFYTSRSQLKPLLKKILKRNKTQFHQTQTTP